MLLSKQTATTYALNVYIHDRHIFNLVKRMSQIKVQRQCR